MVLSDEFIRTIEDIEENESSEDLETEKMVLAKGFKFDAEDDPIQNAWDFNSALQQTIDKTGVRLALHLIDGGWCGTYVCL